MNVHTCPDCGRRFYCRGSLGEAEQLPKHVHPTSGLPCRRTGRKAIAELPPGASPTTQGATHVP